jgi:hypothetical protein
MKALIRVFTTIFFLGLSFNSMAFGDQLLEVDSLDSEQRSQQLTVDVGISCSSKDGSTDCFCAKGCRRTESTCDCTANFRDNEGTQLFESLE